MKNITRVCVSFTLNIVWALEMGGLATTFWCFSATFHNHDLNALNTRVEPTEPTPLLLLKRWRQFNSTHFETFSAAPFHLLSFSTGNEAFSADSCVFCFTRAIACEHFHRREERKVEMNWSTNWIASKHSYVLQSEARKFWKLKIIKHEEEDATLPDTGDCQQHYSQFERYCSRSQHRHTARRRGKTLNSHKTTFFFFDPWLCKQYRGDTLQQHTKKSKYKVGRVNFKSLGEI